MSLPTPNTRKEQYLNAIATGNAGGLPTPITREEEYLDAIAKNGGGGSGDGDMKKSVYDSDLAVANAGGIGAFVSDAVSGKVDKVEGKGLSTNDYDNTEKGKVADNTAAIEALSDTMVANGAHNLLPFDLASIKELNTRGMWNDNVYTIADTTFIVNDDLSITVNNSTPTPDRYIFNVSKYSLRAGSYIYNGCPAGGDEGSRYYIDMRYDDDTQAADLGSGVQVNTVGQSNKDARIIIEPNVQLSNVTFKPMIRLATDPSTEYTPYSMTNRELTEMVTPEQSVQLTMNSNVISSGSCKYTKIGRLVFVNAEYTPTTVANEGVITTGLPPAINGNCSVWDGFAQTLVQNVSDGTARWCFWFPTHTDLDRRQISFMYISQN